MNILTFKDKGNPVAIVKGGKFKNKIVSIAQEKQENEIIPFNLNNFIQENTNYKDRLSGKDIETLKKSLLKKTVPPNEKLSKIYFYLIDLFNKSFNRIFDLNYGDMLQIPSIDQRECIYICGPSGSGKTTYIKHYIEQYRRVFKNRPIYIISKIENDKKDALFNLEKKDKNIMRIPLNKKFFGKNSNSKIKVTELNNSLIIFDDTDTIRDKEIRDEITELKNDILETGRHNNIHILISSHLITKHKQTQTILNECNIIVIFPSSGSFHQIKYALDKYYGLSTQQISKINKLPSRWVMINRRYPKYILHQKGIYLL